MILTQTERDDVYSTVTIEMSRMFEILESLYPSPEEREKFLLMANIEKAITANWQQLLVPAA